MPVGPLPRAGSTGWAASGWARPASASSAESTCRGSHSERLANRFGHRCIYCAVEKNEDAGPPDYFVSLRAQMPKM